MISTISLSTDACLLPDSCQGKSRVGMGELLGGYVFFEWGAIFTGGGRYF